MPRVIAFAWTSPATRAGHKTVTRRTVIAYDRSPRVGGQPVATIALTAAPTFEPNRDAPDGDYEAEGFAWLADHWERLPRSIRRKLGERGALERPAFAQWRQAGGASVVVRFRLIEVRVPLEDLLCPLST